MGGGGLQLLSGKGARLRRLCRRYQYRFVYQDPGRRLGRVFQATAALSHRDACQTKTLELCCLTHLLLQAATVAPRSKLARFPTAWLGSGPWAQFYIGIALGREDCHRQGLGSTRRDNRGATNASWHPGKDCIPSSGAMMHEAGALPSIDICYRSCRAKPRPSHISCDCVARR